MGIYKMIENQEVRNEKRRKVVNLLDRLYNLHEYYKMQETEEEKKAVYEKCEPLFLKLEKLNIKRAFSESILIFGDEFLIFEFGIRWNKMKSLYESM